MRFHHSCRQQLSVPLIPSASPQRTFSDSYAVSIRARADPIPWHSLALVRHATVPGGGCARACARAPVGRNLLSRVDRVKHPGVGCRSACARDDNPRSFARSVCVLSPTHTQPITPFISNVYYTGTPSSGLGRTQWQKEKGWCHTRVLGLPCMAWQEWTGALAYNGQLGAENRGVAILVVGVHGVPGSMNSRD